MMLPKSNPWRSEKHRRLVASLDCVICGKHAPSQCAHANYGKGLGLKTSDALTFPACPSCHSQHDQGAVWSKQERALKEWEYIDQTRANLLRRHLWSAETEQEYQKAIQPVARFVHPEAA